MVNRWGTIVGGIPEDGFGEYVLYEDYEKLADLCRRMVALLGHLPATGMNLESILISIPGVIAEADEVLKC
jgi:hypothetical protein